MSIRTVSMPGNPALMQHAQERAQHFENPLAGAITRCAGSMPFLHVHVQRALVRRMDRLQGRALSLRPAHMSLEAVFLATFVIISQNRADEKRARASGRGSPDWRGTPARQAGSSGPGHVGGWAGRCGSTRHPSTSPTTPGPTRWPPRATRPSCLWMVAGATVLSDLPIIHAAGRHRRGKVTAKGG